MYDDEDENFEAAASESTEGTTVVATRRGYEFVPSNQDIGVITADGVTVTTEQAEAIVAESNGRVSIIHENKE